MAKCIWCRYCAGGKCLQVEAENRSGRRDHAHGIVTAARGYIAKAHTGEEHDCLMFDEKAVCGGCGSHDTGWSSGRCAAANDSDGATAIWYCCDCDNKAEVRLDIRDFFAQPPYTPQQRDDIKTGYDREKAYMDALREASKQAEEKFIQPKKG